MNRINASVSAFGLATALLSTSSFADLRQDTEPVITITGRAYAPVSGVMMRWLVDATRIR